MLFELYRHCGLDPQSPERMGVVSVLGRWRMFLRHDGKGVGGVLLSYIIPEVVKMRPKALEGSLVKHLLELWMRHRDDELGPFLK